MSGKTIPLSSKSNPGKTKLKIQYQSTSFFFLQARSVSDKPREKSFYPSSSNLCKKHASLTVSRIMKGPAKTVFAALLFERLTKSLRLPS
jgi:hypothetical protein